MTICASLGAYTLLIYIANRDPEISGANELFLDRPELHFETSVSICNERQARLSSPAVLSLLLAGSS